MLTTTRGRATVAGLDSRQEYLLQVLVLNGTQEKLIAKRRFTSKSGEWEDVAMWLVFRRCLEGHYVLLVDMTQVKSANHQLLFGGTPGYIPVTSVDFYTHFYHLPG